MTAIASVAAPLIGGLMVAWMDWPGVYWFRVPIAIIALAFLPLLAPRLKANALNREMSTAQTKPSTLRLLFHTSREDKRFLWINIVSAVLQLSTFAIPLLVPYYLSTVAAWPAERIGMVLGCWASGTLLGSMLTGLAAKRWPSHLIAYGAAWLCTSGLICVMLWSDVPNWETGLLRVFPAKHVALRGASLCLRARWVWSPEQSFGFGYYNWQSPLLTSKH
jgi:predicted MFS family arabinose efflux permease